ncbi:MAG: TonB family protein [Chitinophagaceae bacterium]
MQKGFLLVVSLLMFWGLSACAQKNKVTEVYMERTPCFGRCPWYNVYITKEGYIHYEGKKDAELLGVYEGKVPKKEVLEMMKWLQKQQLPTEETSYPVTISDVSRMHMSFKNNGKHVALKNAQEGPAYFKELGAYMDALLQKATWDVVKPQVPEASAPERSTVMPKETTPKTVGTETFTMVEQMPEFPGGNEAMMKFLSNELRYPNEARDKNISGKVIVKFVVDKEGKIQDATIVRGIGAGCDEEALRVVRKMPRWKPGYQNGKAVNVFFHLPVSFVLK